MDYCILYWNIHSDLDTVIEMAYSIKTKKGLDLGVYKGDSPEQAFINLMRDGGYTEDQIWLEDNEVCYYGEDELLNCGRPEDYQITLI